MTTTSFWRALEILGANGAAVCDWTSHLGSDWENCRRFLKAHPGHAAYVLDPRGLTARLDVVQDEAGGFLGIVGDDAPCGPPVGLNADDVALMVPDWQSIAVSLGESLGFAANRFESHGLTRQIGTAQNGTDPVRPVVLCLPAGHIGDRGRIAADFASRRDVTILLPSAKWVTPAIQALVSANRLKLVTLVEQLERTAAVPTLATPPATAGGRVRKKALFRIQSGWRWDMLAIEVACGGRMIANCGGQRKEHGFRKSNSKSYTKEYEILMKLAANGNWRNPPGGSPTNEAVRKQFFRFRNTLEDLIPIPGDAFDVDGDVWTPKFSVALSADMTETKKEIRAKRDTDEPAWHPLSRQSSLLR
ncbi:MAG: hypothetical protein J0M04_16280 [Verrucomicrobia bacterium]|nr:hypothetical protein [Verrucomicrobiota bacterium]